MRIAERMGPSVIASGSQNQLHAQDPNITLLVDSPDSRKYQIGVTHFMTGDTDMPISSRAIDIKVDFVGKSSEKQRPRPRYSDYVRPSVRTPSDIRFDSDIPRGSQAQAPRTRRTYGKKREETEITQEAAIQNSVAESIDNTIDPVPVPENGESVSNSSGLSSCSLL